MSGAIRNLIFIASLVALAATAVSGIAALPEALHSAGIVAPHSWEEVILESLEGVGR
jgi:hypothetical protein